MTDANKHLCLDLIHAESEEEVVDAMRRAGCWEDQQTWRRFGDIENNFSTIGNQQGDPVAALVEKLINSIDARLTGECLANGIDPEDQGTAPPNSESAVRRFFSSPLDEWTDQKLLAEARQIVVIASGARPSEGNPTLSVVDQGEGQAPDAFPDTFLSLNSSNKLRIPFVQGKFNMGGTGALQFCSDRHNLQLIVSRRRPGIESHVHGVRDAEWGFTVIRRIDPSDGMRSSVYEYLAPSGAIPSFESETLPILPEERPQRGKRALPNGAESRWGTLLKLYEYQLGGDRSSIIGRTGLIRRVEAMIPRATLPLRFVETRYQTNGGMTAFGVEQRLEREKDEVLESGFPVSGEISVEGVRLAVRAYAFKGDAVKTCRPAATKAVVFLVNGQTHASFGTQFFSRKAVRKSYIARDLFVSVDCTPLTGRAREDLFLNSRDRMREGPLRERIESELASFLRDHNELTLLNQTRREALLDQKLAEQDSANNQIASEMLRHDRQLRQLLLDGGAIAPETGPAPVNAEFAGKRFPSYFDLKRPKPKEGIGEFEVARGSRILLEFETDAVDGYFSRKSSPGRWVIRDPESGEDLTGEFSSRGPSSGHWSCWSSSLSSRYDVGEDVLIEVAVDDDDLAHMEPFVSWIQLHIKASSQVNTPRPPRPPRAGLRLPDVTQVWEHEADGRLTWDAMRAKGIPFDRDTVVEVLESDDSQKPNSYDIFLNMDNVHLDRRRRRGDVDVATLNALWQNSFILLSLSMLADHSRYSEDDSAQQRLEEEPNNFVFRNSRSIAPVVAALHDILAQLNTTPEIDPN